MFLGVAISFPVYTGLTAKTIGGRSNIIDDMAISDPTLRAMGEMMRKKESDDIVSPTATEVSPREINFPAATEMSPRVADTPGMVSI